MNYPDLCSKEEIILFCKNNNIKINDDMIKFGSRILKREFQDYYFDADELIYEIYVGMLLRSETFQ